MSCNVQMEVCTEQVEWAKAEKRTFLRQRIEARLANLYLSMKDYSSALALISRLLTEASALAMRYVHTSTRIQAHYVPWAAADQSECIWPVPAMAAQLLRLSEMQLWLRKAGSEKCARRCSGEAAG